jgi:hypothetical protein
MRSPTRARMYARTSICARVHAGTHTSETYMRELRNIYAQQNTIPNEPHMRAHSHNAWCTAHQRTRNEHAPTSTSSTRTHAYVHSATQLPYSDTDTHARALHRAQSLKTHTTVHTCHAQDTNSAHRQTQAPHHASMHALQ